MPSKSKQSHKTLSEINIAISPLFIVNNSRLKPFNELFNLAPANVVQQSLGHLFGFFQISNLDDEAAYIVNFLSSVVKKEYYINPKRSVEDSFDLALHKINVALSELAKNGNISWMGYLDAAVCAVSGYRFCFSVCGRAHVLLLRDGLLSDISEGLSEGNEDLNPIKTFVNVSAGNLIPGDKVIITSSQIFNIFSLAEIKKNALRFKPEKFIQFLHTALVNELEIAETLIIDVFEKEKAVKTKINGQEKEKKQNLNNFFSAQTFSEPAKSAEQLPIREKGSASDFVDEKTGHIYVQEEEKNLGRETWMKKFYIIASEAITDFLQFLKKKSRKLLIAAKLKIISFRKNKLEILKAEQTIQQSAATSEEKRKFQDFLERLKKIKPCFFTAKRLLPSISKIKHSYSQLKKEQKVASLIALLAIFVLPLVIIKIKKSQIPSSLPTEIQTEVTLRQKMSNEKNIDLNAIVSSFYSEEKIKTANKVKDALVLATTEKLIVFEAEKKLIEINLPSDSLPVISAAEMNSLNLLFLLTDKQKIFSFSPTTRQVIEQKISFPENARVLTINAYTTYLYTLDSAKNAIYRYPRAEGGFGAGVSWLKEAINSQEIKDLAIDESIYLVTENEIIKLFKGKRETAFNFENSATPFNFDKIFTNTETKNLFVLDSRHARVAVFSKNGELIRQYFNETMLGAKDLVVDEKNNKAYLITSDEKLVQLNL